VRNMQYIACLLAATALAAPSRARADEIEQGGRFYIPMPAGEVLTVSNPLGTVRLRGWDQREVRVQVKKRCRTPDICERIRARFDVDRGRLDINTGVRFADTLRPLPLAGSSIEVEIDAPRTMEVHASSFTGDIDASGFRRGAHLASQEGEIRAADIQGPVDTRSLAGNQSLQEIHGRLATNVIHGDVELDAIDGDMVEAVVYEGQITARAVVSTVVRLRTTKGNIVFVGGLAAGGRYELATHDGDLRLVLRPSGFRIAATAARGVWSEFELSSGPRHVPAGVRLAELRGDYFGGGASLELTSTNGEISLKSAK
jgi:hypothetical protein